MAKANKKFRQFALLFSFIFALASIMLVASGTPDCTSANLRFATLLIFLMYSIMCGLLIIQFIGCASWLKTIPKALLVFYFMIVATMFFTQMILFQGEECRVETPLYFYWLASQVVLFYLVVAWGLAAWGAYICWDAHRKE
jgi:hypothetical protein